MTAGLKSAAQMRSIPLMPDRYTQGRRPVVVTLLALAAVVSIVMVRLLTNLAEPGQTIGAAGDFRDVTYYPVKALLDGVNPYDPEAFLSYNEEIGQWFPIYGPLHLALHLPLAALSFESALWVYAGLTVALTVLLAHVSLGLAGFRQTPAVVIGTATVLLASNGGRANLIDLQPTILLVLGVYLAVALRHRPWLAAVGIAVSFIKPQFGIPLVTFLLLVGAAPAVWRGLLLVVATAIPVTVRLISIEGDLGGVADAVADNVRFGAGVEISDFRLDLTGAFDIGSTVMAFLVGGLFVGLAGALLRHKDPTATPARLTILTAAFLLGLFHVNYDLLLLTWPVMAATAAALTASASRNDRLLFVLLLLAMVNPLTASFVIDLLPISDVLGALSALTLLAAFFVAVRIERQDTAPPADQSPGTFVPDRAGAPALGWRRKGAQ